MKRSPHHTKRRPIKRSGAEMVLRAPFFETIEVGGNKSIAGRIASWLMLIWQGPVEFAIRVVLDKSQETRMSVFSFGKPALSSVRVRLRTVALNLQAVFWGGAIRQYRPEAHYMRGPGPKWREKHGSKGEATGFVQRPVVSNARRDL
jgi:hypothetical protein